MPDSTELCNELLTPRDWIRWCSSAFERAGLCYGHGTEQALDEAVALVAQCLRLPPDLPEAYLGARLLMEERRELADWAQRRIERREPLAYISGRSWFAGLEFRSDPRALIPRSPFAELILDGFEPWLAAPPERILDLCTGGGCIGIAAALAFPDAIVDLVDLSAEALALARENIALHGLAERVNALQGDLFAPCGPTPYDLIVSNPPYVSEAEYAALPAEYHHEPRLGLATGDDGLDIVLRMLDEAPRHLRDDSSLLIVELGATALSLLERRPDLPFTWPEFEHGGDGVFILSRAELAGGPQE